MMLRYLLLTHGAGSNRNAALLVALQNAFSEHDVEVIRYDLPFRQERPHGPPRPGDAARDREGLHEQIQKLREKQAGQVWLGGHSYGGRQASMLAAEAPGIADRLLLLSYPLHPPGKTAADAYRAFSQATNAGIFRARIEGSVRYIRARWRAPSSLIPAPVYSCSKSKEPAMIWAAITPRWQDRESCQR